MSFKEKEDRIGGYLTPHLNEFLFDELSDSYMEKAGIADILTGVPIPIRKTVSNSISPLDIARNMAFVIGCDPQFEYGDNYIAYILRIFGKKFAQGLIGDGMDGAQKKDFDYACIQFRAAMQIDPDNMDAWYCYGRSCKDSYELGEEEEFVGRYKAEALEAFETVTIKKPDFADGYYFLGYAYLNLGLYVKAKLTWETFLELTTQDELRQEISERLATLCDPVEIEKGYNLVLTGHYDEGIEKLSTYKEGKYEAWWPLWYYLGVAYSQLDMIEEAIAHFTKVLQLSPSNIETMEELVKLYEAIGDDEKSQKYSKKIQIVKENAALDKAEAQGK